MGTMGTANIQRTLDIIRVYAEFINRPEMYASPDPFCPRTNLTDPRVLLSSPIVQMFGIVNEPQGPSPSLLFSSPDHR